MDEYLKRVSDQMTEYPCLRYGQTLFNVLYDMDVELANKVRGSELDTFYTKDEQKCDEFLSWLTIAWGG